jgi:UDP-2,3-diacylglucosamine pyrophosphatase LpxH
MQKTKRQLDIVVLSDIHLGTRGCRAKELLNYLKSIETKTLILNGDIIDIWQFKKNYWPSSHMKVVKHIIGIASKKTKVIYITGNHDEIFRRFAGMRMGKLQIVNQLTLEIDGVKTWFFHGDVFDVIMQHSKWLAKAGAIGYDSLIFINTLINRISRAFGRGPVSLSKNIKENVKSAVKYINNFEETAAILAHSKAYEAIVCGHIHHPEIRKIQLDNGTIQYLNSGDWIENLSALEFCNHAWSLYIHPEEEIQKTNGSNGLKDVSLEEPSTKELFSIMLKEFQS